MQRRMLSLAVLFVLAMAASACGAQATPVPVTGGAAAPASAVAAPSGPARVALGRSDSLGSILVDDKGMTLYLYTKDSPNTSACYGKCATAWPPLLTSGTPAGAAGLDASKLGTTTRTDGTVQATYNGWPLYYYAKDKQPGDTTGQDVGKVWYVIAPSGDAVK